MINAQIYTYMMNNPELKKVFKQLVHDNVDKALEDPNIGPQLLSLILSNGKHNPPRILNSKTSSQPKKASYTRDVAGTKARKKAIKSLLAKKPMTSDEIKKALYTQGLKTKDGRLQSILWTMKANKQIKAQKYDKPGPMKLKYFA